VVDEREERMLIVLALVTKVLIRLEELILGGIEDKGDRAVMILQDVCALSVVIGRALVFETGSESDVVGPVGASRDVGADCSSRE